MQVRILTFPFDDHLGGFDDAPLQALAREQQLISVREYFFERDGKPYLALVVTCAIGPLAQPRERAARSQRVSPPWRELLTKEAEPLFSTLRSWRAQRSLADGVPPYIVCTNRQLALLTVHQQVIVRPGAQLRGAFYSGMTALPIACAEAFLVAHFVETPRWGVSCRSRSSVRF